MAFDRLLVSLDGSKAAEESLVHAIRFARAYNSRVFLLQVLDPRGASGAYVPEVLDWRLLKVQALGYLNSLAERLAAEDIETECHVLEGSAPEQIKDFIRDRRIDLLVLSAYGRGGVSAFPFGGTVHKIIAVPEISVMVVRPTTAEASADGRYSRILVLLDGSQRAAWAVSLVSGMVNDGSPEIVLLHVVGLPDMPRSRPLTCEETELRNKFVECNRRAASDYLDEIHERFAASVPIRTRLEVSAQIVETIEQVAEDENVDFIALTAHGASGVVGNNAGMTCGSVMVSASRPVLMLQDSPARYRNELERPDSGWTERKLHAV